MTPNTDSVAVLREQLKGIATHIRACPAYERLLGDADIIEQAAAALSAQGEWPNLPPIPAHAQPQTVSSATLILHPAPPGSDAVTDWRAHFIEVAAMRYMDNGMPKESAYQSANMDAAGIAALAARTGKGE